MTLFSVICWARVERSRGRNDVRGTGKVVEGECRGGGGAETVVEEECRGAGVDCGLPSWLMCFVLVMYFVLMMTNVYKVGPASWERVAREGRTREGSSRGIGGIMGTKGGCGGFEWGTRWVRVGWEGGTKGRREWGTRWVRVGWEGGTKGRREWLKGMHEGGTEGVREGDGKGAEGGVFRLMGFSDEADGHVFLCRRPDKAWEIPGVVLSGFAPDGAFRMVVRPEGRVCVFRLMGVPDVAEGRVLILAEGRVCVFRLMGVPGEADGRVMKIA